MSKLMVIKPYGPIRLASTPILGINVFSLQRTLGVPLPSTILGILGAIKGVILDSKKVKEDELLGIGTLADILSGENLMEKAIVEGPIFKVDTNFAIAFHTKKGAILVKIYEEVLHKLSKCVIPEEAIIGKVSPKIEIGVTLSDIIKGTWDRVVLLGHTYRRAFVYYTNREGATLKVNFLYKLNTNFEEALTLIRLGGEGRSAQLLITSKIPNEIRNLFERITNPLKATPGYYVILNYWPLIPKVMNSIYLDKRNFIGLEFFDDPLDDIIGIPSVEHEGEYKSPRIEVIQLGLGFSEVAKQRRPQILALPPGTIVHIKYGFKQIRDSIPNIYLKLLKVGYASWAL